jgi:hypothetical protein
VRSSDGSTTDKGSVGGQRSNDDDPAIRRVLAARDHLRGHRGIPAQNALSDRAKQFERDENARKREQIEERIETEWHEKSLSRLEAIRKREEAELLEVDPESAVGRDDEPPLVKGVTPGTLQSTVWVAFAFIFVLGLILLVLAVRMVMLSAVR